ncbi:hypothetical protein UNDKW_1973 [Undibacterium sp. KW1]|nr:hypothetical protein UNDKW_1973 [Undibacterium sp. KW1]
MANGWRAQINIKGHRESLVRPTKAQAVAWATERESAIRNHVDTGILKGKTFEDACRRYELEVSKHKRGYRWEALRLNALVEFVMDGKRLGDIELVDMSSDLIGRWRDLRMKGTEETKGVSGSTINRILNLWSHVLSTAATEWKWISHSPTKDVRRPKESPHRDRRPTQDEIDRIKLYCGFNDEPSVNQYCLDEIGDEDDQFNTVLAMARAEGIDPDQVRAELETPVEPEPAPEPVQKPAKRGRKPKTEKPADAALPEKTETEKEAEAVLQKIAPWPYPTSKGAA